jgi:hypothetical protein
VNHDYLEIRAVDRRELEEVFLREVFRRLRTDVAGVVEGYLEENVESIPCEGDRRGGIADEVADAIIEFMRSSDHFANQCPPALEDLVGELGRRGWKLLPPERVRAVRRRLGATRSALTTGKRSGRTNRRRPRVKRLKET